MTGPTTIALAGTLALAAWSWLAAVDRMAGMDMGVATRLGSYPSFLVAWVLMMAAMMLPGAVPAVMKQVRASGRLATAPAFVGCYLAVWALAGLVVRAAYQPHGRATAGALLVVAGLYELTPLKRRFRRQCRDGAWSGFGYGLCCAGSSAGLMLVMVALGPMSLLWMAVAAVLVAGQKLLAPRTAVDVPVALAVLGLGAWLLFA